MVLYAHSRRSRFHAGCRLTEIALDHKLVADEGRAETETASAIASASVVLPVPGGPTKRIRLRVLDAMSAQKIGAASCLCTSRSTAAVRTARQDQVIELTPWNKFNYEIAQTTVGTVRGRRDEMAAISVQVHNFAGSFSASTVCCFARSSAMIASGDHGGPFFYPPHYRPVPEREQDHSSAIGASWEPLRSFSIAASRIQLLRDTGTGRRSRSRSIS